MLGLDLGRAADFSALCCLRWTWPQRAEPGKPPPRLPTLEVDALERWPLGTSYAAVAEWMAAFLKSPADAARYGPPPLLVVDETGVGSAVVEMLVEAVRAARVNWFLAAVTITAGSATTYVAPGRFRVAKKQLASTLVRLFQSRRLKIAETPETPALLREAQTFSVKITPAGNETFESWREGDHDDLVLALALACWGVEGVPLKRWPPAPAGG